MDTRLKAWDDGGLGHVSAKLPDGRPFGPQAAIIGIIFCGAVQSVFLHRLVLPERAAEIARCWTLANPHHLKSDSRYMPKRLWKS
ncbi:hypothetical protein HFN60_13140 [Rhizobium leguminosarum]|uniref:hypothetical protein n=1 Tax=Rhizobium leguminosarum TaxID=384 RepID=UPI001C97EAC2|nr:hypothetical protein [Rhizobium leguminosarum]MBY5816583.1 hypothetical protein [Rhizobium leguminosarum]